MVAVGQVRWREVRPRSSPVTAPAASTPGLTTGIVDFYSGDGPYDLAAAKAGGIIAIIHKATEGLTYRDRGFADAMNAAAANGVLRGAYHFGNGASTGAQQADAFLSVVGNNPDILLALDLERNPNQTAGTMTTSQAAQFVQRIYNRTGRWPILYAGLSDLVNRVHAASSTDLLTLAHCDLWLAKYGEAPASVPAPWGTWSLWQYSDYADGPADRAMFPRVTSGFGRVDRSVFRGSPAQLRAWWSSTGRNPSMWWYAAGAIFVGAIVAVIVRRE